MGGFYAFHTGTDILDADTETDSGLLMTWIGVGQTFTYSAWLPSGSDNFNPTPVITSANSNSAPVVTYNHATNSFDLVFRGLLDNRVYLMSQVLGESTWSTPVALTGLTTPTSPVIAADFLGNRLVSAVDFDGNIWFQAINSDGTTRGWSEESTQAQTGHPVWLSIVGDVFYVAATFAISAGVAIVQWKRAWDTEKR
jgi:hypothetical protein